MYPVSDAFRQAIQSRATTTRVFGTITAKTGYQISFDNTSLSANTFKINSKCVSGSEYELGSVYAAELAMTLKTDVDRYVLYDAEISASFGILLPDGTWEDIPLGVFIVNEANRTGRLISIKALDRMILADDSSLLLSVNAEGTPYELLLSHAQMCGLELAQSQEEIEAMPNGTTTIGFDATDSYCPSTPREVFSFVSAWLAGFAYMNREGKLAIGSFSAGSPYIIPSDKKSDTSVSDFSIHFTALKATVSDSNFIVTLDEEENTGQTLIFKPSPFLENGLQETIEQALSNILAAVSQVTFVPLETSLSGGGDPSLELGDYFSVEGTGPDRGSFFSALLMSYEWSFRSKHKIKCLGKNPRLNATKTSTVEKELQSILTDIADTEIIYNSFRNLKDMNIAESETYLSIIQINFMTTKLSSGEFKAMIHATSLAGDPILIPVTETRTVVEYSQAEDGTLISTEVEKEVIVGYTMEQYKSILNFVYYLDNNEITNLYPVETISGGKHLIWLYYAFEDLVPNVLHTFDVRLRVQGSPIEIPKFHILANLIGQGMASMKAVWDGRIEFEEHLQEMVLIEETTTQPVSIQKQITAELSVAAIYPISIQPFVEALLGAAAFTHPDTHQVSSPAPLSASTTNFSFGVIKQSVLPSHFPLTDFILVSEKTVSEEPKLTLKQEYVYVDEEATRTLSGSFVDIPVDTTGKLTEFTSVKITLKREEEV